MMKEKCAIWARSQRTDYMCNWYREGSELNNSQAPP